MDHHLRDRLKGKVQNTMPTTNGPWRTRKKARKADPRGKEGIDDHCAGKEGVHPFRRRPSKK